MLRFIIAETRSWVRAYLVGWIESVYAAAHVHAVDTPNDAIAAYVRHGADLLLISPSLPLGGSAAILDHLRLLNASTPIIIFDSPPDAHIDDLPHTARLLENPFQPRLLASLVAELLAFHQTTPVLDPAERCQAADTLGMG